MNYLFKKLFIKVILHYYSLLGYGVIVYGYSGIIIDTNKKACKLLQYEKTDLLYKSFLMLLPVHKLTKNLDYFESVITNNCISKFEERTRMTKSGNAIKVLLKPIRFPNLNLYFSIAKLK